MTTRRRRIAIRLEGGIGDHLLGMRVIPFARRREPEAEIVVYSDGGGGSAQVEAVELCLDVERVVAVRHKQPPGRLEEMGPLANIEDSALRQMRDADLFLDGWGGSYFAPASSALDVPVLEILAGRPRLVPPDWAVAAADQLVTPGPLVGLNLTKYGPGFISLAKPALNRLLGRLLTVPGVRFAHFYRTRFDYTHWPGPARRARTQLVAQELRANQIVDGWHESIIPIVDQPLAVVAALLARCSYYIGVDNGMKHLAWALDIPRTILVPELPEPMFAVRWMPDYHRAAALDSTLEKIYRHAEEAHALLAAQAASRNYS